ncbi:MAG TPA: hypothetical protein VNQ80_12015 [Parapedobacter sp.]|uniref:hypothetical protein n=1 Tax=Parapedobacter sp. TaxID=1958893 RepID=UPI002CE121FF|nr:hypothetical protein [Parapedobacter sp.]HWK58062.1 hypothetical protein [Parapedobacter sp.]
MKTYLHAYFNKLKTLVLKKAEITQLVPADCYRLALEIKGVTNKSVSETTLKRVFGFASSVHQPSIYTLNALAEYCGFESWDVFYTDLEQNKLQTAQQRTWGEISLNATKISLFNIQSNKYKCGIPYHLTIDREYIGQFAERFLQSGATTGILHGPVGCGKTIGISRWVEKQIGQIHVDSSNDIYLFINGLSLLQGTAFGYHSNRWLAHLLGFETTDLLDAFMENHRTEAPGNFYLIIDELHSDLVADRQFHMVICQFMDMVNHFAQFTWFRIILILRTASLLKFESLFKETVINPQWFSMQHGRKAREASGMPAFTHAELHQLAQNINGSSGAYPLQKARDIRLIHTPLFFQYYYELAGDHVDPYQITSFKEYLIITQYLKKKVFNGVNTLGKQSLLEELSLVIEQQDGRLQINRKQAYPAIRQHRVAYNDLLYSGLLHETNCDLELRQHTVVQFQSDIIANYFIALELFSTHTDATELIDAISISHFDNKSKTAQLKWLLLFQIKSGDLQLVNELAHISFIEEDIFDIITFICDGLHRLAKYDTAVREKINIALHDTAFIDYLLHYISFQVEFEPSLEKLLYFDLTEKHEISVRSKLATIALLKWDEETLLKQLEPLAAMPREAYAPFAINPFLLLSYLYQRFKGGAIDPQVVRELNALPYRLPLAKALAAPFHIDILLYLYIKVSGNRAVALPYQKLINERFQKMPPINRFEIDIETLIIAFYLWENGDVDEALSRVKRLSLNTHDNSTYRLLYIIFQLQIDDSSTNHAMVEISQRAITLCEARGFKLIEAYCRMLILERVSKEERLQHINNLKFQFAAYGYTAGLGALTKRYG